MSLSKFFTVVSFVIGMSLLTTFPVISDEISFLAIEENSAFNSLKDLMWYGGINSDDIQNSNFDLVESVISKVAPGESLLINNSIHEQYQQNTSTISLPEELVIAIDKFEQI